MPSKGKENIMEMQSIKWLVFKRLELVGFVKPLMFINWINERIER